MERDNAGLTQRDATADEPRAAPDIRSTLVQAVAAHQQGRLIAARAGYERILQFAPEQFDALHLLGVIALQEMQPEEGVALIRRAIEVNPRHAAAYLNMARGLTDLQRLDEALESLDRAIRLKPDYAEAFCNRGHVLTELKRPAEALASCDRALALKPDQSVAHSNRANALQALGRSVEALESCDRAIAFNPGHAEAHCNRGNALQALGQLAEALASYDRALALNPTYALACRNRGSTLRKLGRLEEALTSFDRAIALAPEHCVGHYARANVLETLGRLDEALAALDRAIALSPACAEAHNGHGNVLQALGRLPEALASFDRAIALEPDQAIVHSNRGNALRELKRPAEALASCDRAIALEPDCVEAHNNRGNALQELGRASEALASFERAIALAPEHAPAHSNRGNALQALGRAAEALASCDRAIALDHNFVGAHNNRGMALQSLGRPAEALASYDRAIVLKPDFAHAHWNESLCRLLLGDFETGWRKYQWRWQSWGDTSGPRDPHEPLRLEKEDLSGKTILLRAEQGLGDELFFLRFASRARARGARLAYLASPRIASIVERSGAVDRVVESAAQAGEVEHVLPVGDLPLILGSSNGEPLPPPLALTPLPERLEAARAQLRALGPGPYLALTWRAGIPLAEQQGRSSLFKEVEIAALMEPLAGWQGEIVAVQRRPQSGEVQRLAGLLGRPVHDLTALNEDLEAMLGLLAAMDDYVAVSNTNVHLMAGLGRSVRLIVPHPPEWRWLHEGATSPWFPRFRLYRQAPGQPIEQTLAPLGVDLCT